VSNSGAPLSVAKLPWVLLTKGKAELKQWIAKQVDFDPSVLPYNQDFVQGLDEGFAVAFNDVDFCLHVRDAGYKNVWTPSAEMIHHESLSRGKEDNPEKIARFQSEIHRMKQRWGDALLNDPAYSPNLAHDREDFSMSWR
jgi:hypothetical protein